MAGGVGDDTYIVDDANDTVIEAAGEGNDTINSSASITLPDNVEWLNLTGGGDINAIGSAGDNNITGNAGANQLDGGAGNDQLTGGFGNDTLDGGAGVDYLTGGSDDDIVRGGADNDTLRGDAGNDTLEGGSGNDHLDGGSGADIMAGGAGDDTYIVDDANDSVIEAAGEGNDTINSSASITLPDNVEWLNLTGAGDINATGSAGDNNITGNAGANRLDGGSGNDTLSGGDGNDTLIGGDGNDTLKGVNGNDNLDGGAGDDTLDGGYGSDTLSGGEGTDTLYGGSDDDTLDGGIGADYLDGGYGVDTLDGGADNDTLYGGVGNDTLYGGDGADYLYGDDAYGSIGHDILYGGTGNDTLYGQSGNDTLDGGAGADVLYGDAGNDILDGGADVDELYGGAGDDTYVNATGEDTIGDYFGNNTIQLAATSIGAAGLTTVQVPNGTGGYYLQLQISLNTGGSVKLNSPFFTNGSDTLQFSDGNAINLETLVGEQLFTPLNLMLNSLGGRIYGGAGADYLYGWTGRDTLIGHRGNDRLYGDGNDDTLIGGEGNDLIHGGGGNDTIDGGSGNDDMYGYGSSGEQTPPPDGNDTYLFSRGYGQDRIFESSTTAGNVDVVQMLAGVSTTDVTVTRDGLGHMHLSINGTTDKLTIYNYFLGDAYKVEQIRFADGAVWDSAMLAALSSQNHAPALTDEIADLSILEGAPFSFTVPLGTFTDPDADDVLVYSATLADGSALPSWLDFDPAICTFSGTPSTAVTLNVSVTAKDAGNLTATDTFDITVVGVPNVTLNGTSATDTLNGGAGHDTLNGLAGNDTLNGNAGNDRLDGGTGNDTMKGGTGDDTYVVDSTADIVTENTNEGIDTIESSVTLTLANNVEKLILTGTSAINGTGNTLGNTITGNSANNTLSGGTGADTLIGGAGNDTYIVDNTGDVVTELANEGTDLVQASVTTTLAANVENLTLTGTTVINGTGNTLDNVLTGNSANNTLTGGAGNDRINGGTGNDTMVGGTGNDTYVVNVTTDIVTENANEGTDTIESSVTLTLANNVENLTLTGTSAINGTGNILDNVLTGNSAVNTLTGGAGNDRLDGKGGADKMLGGIGDDTYIVDKTTDVITENANEGLDTVESTVTFTLGNNVENLTLMGTSAINGTGNTLNNRLQGNSAVNSLSGAAGNDTLEGIGGADTLTGGTGNDTYILGRGYAADTVVENDTTTGNTDVAQFLTGVAADQIWFKKATNNLEVSIIGTSDKLVIKDWYLGNAHHVEQFKTTDGAKTLTDSNVQNLVNAMASFAPPAAGQTTLPTNYQTSLAPVIAANWQ